MDEIIPRLWVGDLPSAMNVAILKANGIFSILSAMRGRITVHETFIRHQILLDDEPEADVLMHFLPAINFIDQELSKGRGVLVHCQAGMSRSVIIVAAYLMWKANGALDVDGALELIRQKRPHAEPNEGFVRQLDIFHKAAFRVSRGDKATRMYYLEKTTEEVMNGDGEPPSPTMFAKFPRTPSDSIPPTPTTAPPPRRRIRCKMCRQELATREHMLDHGQLGPATPAMALSPAGGSPANSRRPSRRSSSNQPSSPRSRIGSFTTTTPTNDTKPRRPSLLSFGGLGDTLSMSTLDPNDNKDVIEEGAPLPLSRNATPKPATRSLSAGTESTTTTLISSSRTNGSLSAGGGGGRPFSNMSQDILDTLSNMSAIESSDEEDAETSLPPVSEIKRTRSFGRAAKLGRKMSDALIASTPPSNAVANANNNNNENGNTEPLTTTMLYATDSSEGETEPENEIGNGNGNANANGSSTTAATTAVTQSQFSSPLDLAAALSSNPKLAALRSPSLSTVSPGVNGGNSPSNNNNSKILMGMGMGVSPPILVNAKCSGYFVEPLLWMDHFLSSGSVAGKITCPNKKCGVKLGNYDWAGVCCGCKEWVVPGFCIARNKVDEVV